MNNTSAWCKKISTPLKLEAFLNERQPNSTTKFTPMVPVVFCPTATLRGPALLAVKTVRGVIKCDACGATYEAVELKNPVSKMNPDASVEIRETDHLFYRLDLFQKALETHAQQQQSVWKANVKAMTKQWLDMGLRPRAVTRDLSWGIPVPLDGGEWDGKCIYVWFEAVQGYSTCARIWSQNHASQLPDGEATWKRWWCVDENGTHPRHLYFLGKDNIPFHTVIWPALILGMNHVNNGLTADDPVALPGPVTSLWNTTSLPWNT